MQSANGETHTVLAVYTVRRDDEYVTRTEYYIDNADVPSGGGTGGTKTTWSGTCSTASATAAATVDFANETPHLAMQKAESVMIFPREA